MALILAVDDDPIAALIVTQELEKNGHTVVVAADGNEALAAVARTGFDLIVTDVMMPNVDGWALIRALRSRPETALTPVIFLTGLASADNRIQGFRLGADDYLAKPFRPDELSLRVEKTLRAYDPRMARNTIAQPSGVEGSLAQMGFSALLMIFEMERKTGTLSVLRGAEVIRFALRNGRVIRSSPEGAVPEGLPAADYVYRALTWSDGRFAFTAGAIEGDDEIKMPTQSLLMEGARRLDEGSQ